MNKIFTDLSKNGCDFDIAGGAAFKIDESGDLYVSTDVRSETYDIEDVEELIAQLEKCVDKMKKIKGIE